MSLAEDTLRIFDLHKDLPYEARDLYARNTLNFLNSDEALQTYSVADIAYMRKVWLTVAEQWSEDD